MKRNHFFYVAVAALSLSFAACSQDDVTPEADKFTSLDKETSYVNVKIATRGGLGTRAAEDSFGDFDIGTEDEGAVNSLALVLYDANGGLAGLGSLSSEDLQRNRQSSGSVSDIYSGVVAVKIIPGAAQPAKIIALVNTDEMPSDPYETIFDLKTGDIGNVSRGGLIMTTSGYYKDDSEWVEYTEVSEDNLFDTPAEAAAASSAQKVQIYVERLAAKVTVDNQSTDNEPDNVFYGSDGHTYKIKFDAKKWAATGLAKEMYVFKNAFDADLNEWANDEVNFRSYWANGVYYNDSYDVLAANKTKLTYLWASQIVQNGNDLDGEEPIYITEHTYGTSAQKNGVFRHEMVGTNAIVVGQYTIEALDEGDVDKFKGSKDGENDFYISLRGFEDGKETLNIYSRPEIIKILLKRNGIEGASKTMRSSTELTDEEYPQYFSLRKSEEDGSYSLTVAFQKNVYKLNSDDMIQDFELSEGTFNAAHYRNGWAYFFIPIQHNIELEANEVGAYGVVRNHSYKITVNSIKGLGAPMDYDKIGDNPEDPDDPTDPEEPIIPDEEDLRNAYISATLNVLSWHNSSYGVDL